MTQQDDQLTALLRRATEGDKIASEKLLSIVYEQLRLMARARMGAMDRGQTLQPTALVHEAYMKLVRNPDANWDGRAHFFGAAARAMREILVDHARSRHRIKRGGDRKRVEFDNDLTVGSAPEDDSVDLIALDAALHKLAQHDPRAAEVVTLRFFGGLEIEQAARAMGISVATANRDWRYAKAFLSKEIQAPSENA